MLWLKLSLRELFKNRGFAFFFILNLSLGLAGFIAIHSFGSSMNRHLEDNLKQILTADLVLSSNSPMTDEELSIADDVLGPDKVQSRLIRFYTMVRTINNARLARVMAIDNNYPLYGEFSLESNTSTNKIQEKPGLFMTRDAAHALGIPEQNQQAKSDLNTPITLGKKQFQVQDFFLTDPDKSLTAVELAPKIYMGINQLEGTGLIQFGSRIRYLYYYKFNNDEDIAALTDKLKNTFSKKYGPPRINIYNSKDVNQRLGRITRYFTSFMGLVSIVALFLAGIATAYLFRGYMDLKKKEMAVLMSIGAKHGEIYFYLSIQLIILGTLASLIAVFISFFLVPAFPIIFQGLIPPSIKLAIDPFTIILAVCLGMAGSMIFCLPVFISIFGVKPLILLRGTRETKRTGPKTILARILSFLPGITSFFLISVIVADSIKSGIIFVLGFALALAFLSFMGWILFSGCRFLSHTRNFTRKIAFRNLFRNKWSSLSCFVTISMGAFLISIIPQVQKGLQTEIMKPEGLKIPIFFLVDLQDEQKELFSKFMSGQKAELVNISPMIRGRITSVNQKPFYDEQTDDKSRHRRREFNFSYRNSLDVSETIIQGKPLSRNPWSFESKLPFEISVAKSFAQRHDLAIGDIMEFDVQGIPLKGRVRNIRKVRWNSFQPNFFLLFQDGVLNDAPKTFLAAISNVAPENRQDLKNRIVKAFPNISVIDVARMAKTMLDITDRLSLSIRFMAWLAIVAGLVSIFSIARHEAFKNEHQINLLKVLGADFKEIQSITLLEFGFIGFTAALFAILLSFGFSLAISWYFFDSLWQFDFIISLAILFLTTFICMGTALLASRKVMKTKPVKLLATS